MACKGGARNDRKGHKGCHPFSEFPYLTLQRYDEILKLPNFLAKKKNFSAEVVANCDHKEGFVTREG